MKIQSIIFALAVVGVATVSAAPARQAKSNEVDKREDTFMKGYELPFKREDEEAVEEHVEKRGYQASGPPRGKSGVVDKRGYQAFGQPPTVAGVPIQKRSDENEEASLDKRSGCGAHGYGCDYVADSVELPLTVAVDKRGYQAFGQPQKPPTVAGVPLQKRSDEGEEAAVPGLEKQCGKRRNGACIF